MGTRDPAVAPAEPYWIMGLRPRRWLAWLADDRPLWQWHGIDEGHLMWSYTTEMIRRIAMRVAIPVGSRTVAVPAAGDRWRWSQIIEGVMPDQIALAFSHAGPSPPDPRPGAIPTVDVPYAEWVERYHMYDWSGTLAALQRRADEEVHAAREWSSRMPVPLSVRPDDPDPVISCPRCQAPIRLDGAFVAISVAGRCDHCGVEVEYRVHLVLVDPRAE